MTLFEPTKSDLHLAAECLAERMLVLSALRSEAARLKCTGKHKTSVLSLCENCSARLRVMGRIQQAKKLMNDAKKKMIETYQKTK